MQDLTSKDRPPAVLLKLLSQSGIHLLPEDRDAEYVGLETKEKELEIGMCQDLSLLAATFMLSSSKWNKEQSALVTARPMPLLAPVTMHTRGLEVILG